MAAKQTPIMFAKGGLARTDAPMRDALRMAVSLLSATHGTRDTLAVEHQHRVAGLAVSIGGTLGLSASRLETLRLAAMVHDIGKIALPAEILNKPGALTDAEYALIKGHCFIAFNILERLGTSWPIAEIAYQHHERMDGSGYPRGLAGADILLEARILAVADVYDAMSSTRSYRAGLPRDFVLGEVQKMAGRQLDADAVAACRNLALLSPESRHDPHPERKPIRA
jgi:putative two-component system response regulator